jgi:hypothetical protein
MLEPSINGLDEAQLALYHRRLNECICIEKRGAIESHQIAVRFAIATRPTVELSPEAWQRDFEDVEVVAARQHG